MLPRVGSTRTVGPEGVAAVNPDLLPRARIARDQVDAIRRVAENTYKKGHPVRLAAVVASEAVGVLVKELEGQ